MRTQARLSAAILLGLFVTVLASAPPAAASEEDTVQRAMDVAVAQVQDSLAARRAEDPKRFADVPNVAVIPLRRDTDNLYATNAMKTALTKTQFKLFTRLDETWDKLLAEIEWGVKREDVMDSATVQKFGKIKGVDAILYGDIWESGLNLWSIRGYVKMTVRMADVETGQILWSSGPVVGEAYIHWSDAIMEFWRYPLLLIGALLALIIILLILRGLTRAVRHAARPL